MIYALDTNIIIQLLNRNNRLIEKRAEIVDSGGRMIIPCIVDYEIQRGFFYKTHPQKEGIYLTLCSYYGIGEMTDDSWKQAARIYAKLYNKSLTIGDADIFIAAFCITNDYTLVTHNTKHFDNIDGLNFEDWLT